MNKQLKPLVLAILATFTLSAQAVEYNQTVKDTNVSGDPDIHIGTSNAPVTPLVKEKSKALRPRPQSVAFQSSP